MHLENLRLENFKNYESLNLEFSPRVTCIIGKNGSGKTNILDAIHYLCLTKSLLNSQDKLLLYPEASYYFLKGDFVNSEKEKQLVLGGFKQKEGKFFKLDEEPYAKLSEHIGKFPVVFVHPNDIDLVREGSEYRRKFFDSILCQCDREYLHYSIEYKQVLKQRNAQLKQFSDMRFIDHDLLEVFDDKLLELNAKIHDKRAVFCERFAPVFLTHYKTISGNSEDVSLVYKSAVGELDFKTKYKRGIDRDIFLQRTNLGIHKDEFLFELEGNQLKKFGSQGQQKSFIISLQLAKLKYIESVKGFTPILLLDDIFDKLDDDRIQKLVNMIVREEIGQVVITDANVVRTKELFSATSQPVRFVTVDNAEIVAVDEK